MLTAPLRAPLLALLAAGLAGCGTPTGSSTTSAQQSTSSAPGVSFTNCGDATYIEPAPAPFTLEPGGTIPAGPASQPPMTDKDVLSFVHQAILQNTDGLTATGPVSCRAKQLPSSQLGAYLGHVPQVTSSVWVVVVSGAIGVVAPSVSGPPSPGGNQTQVPGGTTAVVFLGANHPATVYTVSVFHGNTPSQFAG